MCFFSVLLNKHKNSSTFHYVLTENKSKDGLTHYLNKSQHSLLSEQKGWTWINMDLETTNFLEQKMGNQRQYREAAAFIGELE